jgi:2-oxoglutarate dehydrogenase E1 component
MSGHFNSVFQNNAGYIEELFAQYTANPNSVGNQWRAYFEGFQEGFGTASTLAKEAPHYEDLLKKIGSFSSQTTEQNPKETTPSSFEFHTAAFVLAWRAHGHLKAATNPLDSKPKTLLGSVLDPKNYGILPEDFGRQTHAGLLIGLSQPLSFQELMQHLEKKFAGPVGAEIDHIENHEERQWLFEEFLKIDLPVDKKTQTHIYTELAQADCLEKTLATKYIGKKRFSIEGAEAQYVALESFLEASAQLGMEECTVGIAHRGRLNLLVNAIGKPLESLFAEFEGYPHADLQGDCDVKYHFGYESTRKTRSGKSIVISMPFNPSHLEYVGSVVMGDTRARQMMSYQGDSRKVASVVLHGDAAISGQGVVYETAQMMRLEGYHVGGTLHIVANNQVGFTTNPLDSRSSTYCTDIAKVTNSPVFHVNGDHLDTLHHVVTLAAKYRATFHKDFYIDIVCFRRHGHNESDEPNFTQPALYKLIKDKPAPFEEYATYLTQHHAFVLEDLKNIYSQFKKEMDAIYDRVKAEHTKIKQFKPFQDKALLSLGTEQEMLQEVQTKLDLNTLKDLAQKISTLPSNFHPNPKLSRIVITERKEMAAGNKKIDWGMAELLAYASLLNEGYSIRLVGEDAKRGTFSHRHVTLTDTEDEHQYNLLSPCLLQNAQLEVINSLLSEEAALGYEYGYAVRHAYKALVLWEAQFGDFANGAQVIVDQFLAGGESKWCQTQALVLLLPHGMEGQGAEHSSARLERFLQLCAQGNLQVGSFTNGAQLYHAMRRQMLRNFRKPLILMTPKSFLRNPKASTTLEELATGQFHEILKDPRNLHPEQIKRVIFCTGKIALDLLDALEKEDYQKEAQTIAIVRVEQLYPFHAQKAAHLLSLYTQASFVCWVQEEPANMGAWSFIRLELEALLKTCHCSCPLIYFGRSRRAVPAVGLEKLHFIEQEKLIEAALRSPHFVEI